MPPEIAKLNENVQNKQEVKVSESITFTTGTLCGKNVVYGSAGVGMVFATINVTTMINMFNLSAVIFTGVAGGLKADQRVGDIVILQDTINYDMNCKNFFLPGHAPYRRGEIPFVDWLEYPSDPQLVSLASAAPLPADLKVSVRVGRVVTGSEFVIVPRKVELKELWEELGNPEAVEMECAAIAQACRTFGKPFLGLRAISDTLEGDANSDFNQFTQEAANNLWCILSYVVENL
jgi:adenosylhomocysteine nucleosidase